MLFRSGTDDGLVWRTNDGGAHWQNVTPRGLAPWSKIGTIEPSHFDPNVAYVAVDRHRLDDFAPYIYATHDGGKSWTLIANGIAPGGILNTVNVVREDFVRRGLLFAGTERGVFVSFNDGADWQPLQRGLPPTSVRDIDIHGGDLVIATHGRSFYIMDDVEPLRELAVHPQAGARLFAPATAIRFRASGFTGTPMPKDEPTAPNPPEGAPIDYVLPAHVKAPVRLLVSDANGLPVRSYVSGSPQPMLDPAKLDTAPEWVPVPIPLRSTPGEHRFMWDMHYEKPASLEGEREEGVWAPPGRYAVTLMVDGQSYKQWLDLKPDPRVHAKPADYQHEFALAQQIDNARGRAGAAMKEAQTLHAEITQRAAKADTASKARFLALDGALLRLSALPSADAHNVPSAPAMPDSLAGLLEGFGQLAQAVDGADGAPTPDAESGFRQRTQALATALAEWGSLKVQIENALKK